MSSTENHPETDLEPMLEEMWSTALEICTDLFDASNHALLSPSEMRQAFALLMVGHLRVIRSIQHLESRIDAATSGKDDQNLVELRYLLPSTLRQH